MAKYRFYCEKCNRSVEKITSIKTEAVPCLGCSGSMLRQFPNIGSKKVTETVDPYLNIRHEEDHKKKLDDRRTEYFWQVEVPRLIETYSIETCLEHGWLVYNDKNELVIGKTPPSRKK